MTVKIAIVGAGQMGMQHARTVAASARAKLTAIVDPNLERAERLANHVGCEATTQLEAAIQSDGVVVAAPTEQHVPIALSLLAESRPLLVEKPIAVNPSQVHQVINESDTRGVPITCGFVERFNPAVVTALNLIAEPPLHLLSWRHSPQTPRINTSVVFDLLIHDIDLALQFANKSAVREVSGAVLQPENSPVNEIADCTIQFEGGMIGTLSSSRRGQRKVRLCTVATQSEMFEIDLLRANVTVFRNVRQEQVIDDSTTYRAETIMDIPFVRHAGEPLFLQMDHFLDLIEGSADADTERRSLFLPHEIAASVEAGASAR
jgi:predicted dehydrogenase